MFTTLQGFGYSIDTSPSHGNDYNLNNSTSDTIVLTYNVKATTIKILKNHYHTLLNQADEHEHLQDLQDLQDLQEIWSPSYEKPLYNTLSENIDTLTKTPFAIIPIHAEMYLLAERLVNRVLNTDKNKNALAIQKIFQNIEIMINKNIAQYLNSKLKISVAEFNKFLDKKRKTYADLMILDFMTQHRDDIRTDINTPKFKTDLESSSATDKILTIKHTTPNNKTSITTISSSPYAAHSKDKHAPAFRTITHTISDTENENIQHIMQSQTRVPSLTAYNEDNNQETSVFDQITQHMQQPDNEGKSAHYRLLTSLPARHWNSWGAVERFFSKNTQTENTKEILYAAHKYNYTHANMDPDKYFYVMNIPVNQWDAQLSYKGTGTQKEALLMSDLSLINTLKTFDIFNQDISTINTQYTTFLTKSNKQFFSISTEGEKAIALIKELKQEKQILLGPEDHKTLIVKALWEIYRTKYDGSNTNNQIEYGSLIQAMSMVVSDSNDLKGCKSANERFWLVESLNYTLLHEDFSEMLKSVIKRDENAIENFAKQVHKTCNEKYIYGPANYISNLDTGPAKGKKDWGACLPETLKNSGLKGTNGFFSNLFTNVSQNSASELQTHKGLYDKLKSLPHKKNVDINYFQQRRDFPSKTNHYHV